jgi:N-acetylmuramoyl-L-alanine amidase CwlA
MSNFILLAKSKNFAEMGSTVCATGGGATKFAALTEKVYHLSNKLIDF